MQLPSDGVSDSIRHQQLLDKAHGDIKGRKVPAQDSSSQIERSTQTENRLLRRRPDCDKNLEKTSSRIGMQSRNQRRTRSPQRREVWKIKSQTESTGFGEQKRDNIR
ncbi:hypothetical protein BDN72DRAFT_264146 [Pluteus cervinus]|uniref:Uncharacterized protein n=1 Tax=Pluteus cervinus TaxID=181527 RepID=A0ACD3AEW9_9AGAR|nr:hypothetical protein BDN72DRAFT_264146 [Pluteus cervinus]